MSYKLRRLLLVTIDNTFMHVCILLKSVYLHTGTQGDVYLVYYMFFCLFVCLFVKPYIGDGLMDSQQVKIKKYQLLIFVVV